MTKILSVLKKRKPTSRGYLNIYSFLLNINTKKNQFLKWETRLVNYAQYGQKTCQLKPEELFSAKKNIRTFIVNFCFLNVDKRIEITPSSIAVWFTYLFYFRKHIFCNSKSFIMGDKIVYTFYFENPFVQRDIKSPPTVSIYSSQKIINKFIGWYFNNPLHGNNNNNKNNNIQRVTNIGISNDSASKYIVRRVILLKKNLHGFFFCKKKSMCYKEFVVI